MPSILKKEQKHTLKKRNVSHSSVKIENVGETKVQFVQSSMENSSRITRSESFFESVWPVIYVAQCFGFMPIQAIRSGDPFKFEFRWKTFRVLITLIYMALAVPLVSMYSFHIARLGIKAKNIVGVVFYVFGLLVGIVFLALAKRFKNLAITWHRHEKIFLDLPYKECGWRLSTKIRITAVTILFFAIVEHSLAIANAVCNFYAKLSLCDAHVDDHWKYYFLNEHSFIYSVLPYHFLITIIVEWGLISLTFGWSYMDTFIIVTSIGLATRFKQINQRLEEIKNEPMDESLWADIRHHYVQLCELVEVVDKNLAVIILLCCSNNLYFICFQLLNIFNKMPHMINFLYFWYSLLYLLGRTIAVFLAASMINDSAKYPVKYVRQRQTCEWCSELERLGDQISTEVVALSGMKFFYITRSLLLGMAGTIVTYELVLLQFDDSSKKTSNETSLSCDPF